MWNVLNSRFVAAAMITFGLPLMLYVAAMLSSKAIAHSIVSGVGDSFAEMAQGEKKKTIQDIVSGFTGQIISGLTKPFSEMKNEQEQKAITEVAILESVKVKDTKIVPGDFGAKVIGTITNNSDKTLSSIHVSVSAYDAEGKLQNVSSEWVNDIKAIQPKQSINFGIEPRILRPSNGDKAFVAPARVEVSVSDFSIMKVESKEKSDAS